MINEYQEMLLDSARKIHNIIKKPQVTDENKIIIASANALAQTAKTAIQMEVLHYKSKIASQNTTQLINRIASNEIISVER